MNLGSTIFKTITFVIVVALSVIFLLFAYKWCPEQRDLFLNLATESFGIFLTVVVIDKLLRLAENQKWVKIKARLLDNLGNDLLRFIIRLDKNGTSRITVEKLNDVYKQIKESDIEKFATDIMAADEIFKQNYKAPIITELQKYVLVNSQLRQCIQRCSEILHSQNYGISADTENFVYDFFETAENFCRWLATIQEQLPKMDARHDRTLQESWNLIQNEYQHLIEKSLSLLYHIIQEGFRIKTQKS